MKKKIIILLLVCASILTTGCKLALYNTREERPYKAGNFTLPLRAMSMIMMGIKSDANEFEKQNVVIDLYYGLYNNAYIGENLEYVASTYKSGDDEPLYVGVYICDGTYEYDAAVGDKYDNYRDIDNYYMIKELSEQEAFSGEYGYDVPSGRNIEYNHSESFLIPEEWFSEDKGKLYINIIVFRDENDGVYTVCGMELQEIKYELTEDEKIIITNLKK